LREQVVAQRVGDRGGLYGKRRSGAIAQRPARRGGSPGETLRERLRSITRYVPLVLKLVLVIAAAMLIFTGYRDAASATFFQVRSVDVRGTSRASSAEIQAIVRRQAGQKGLWQADLSAISAQLERLPWVRTAVVTRVLPDGVRVRITERVQRAVIRNSVGRLVWVDDDAVMLGETLPTDQMPTFFLRGWNEDKSEEAILGNRERVQKYLELTREWGAAGLSERVSEVNLIDLHDVRVQLAGDDSQIEVRLGAADFGKRLKKALTVLDEQRQTSYGPLISYIDLTQGVRAIVGLTSGVKITSNSSAKTTESQLTSTETEKANANSRKATSAATDRGTLRDKGAKDKQRTGQTEKSTH
jgi:cell division septal protein FtsQ